MDGLCVALKYDTMTALVQVLPDDLKSGAAPTSAHIASTVIVESAHMSAWEFCVSLF